MSLALEELSERIRALTPDLVLVEKKMFNGRAFMHRGNMLVCPIKDGTLLVRVGKDGMAAALERPGASPMVMNGRTMGGFVFVTGDAIEDDEVLGSWLTTARDFVATLPPK
jgi:hypothetical protein